METPMERVVCNFFGINEPIEPKIKIGVDAQFCPECKNVLSFTESGPFCRCCQARIRKACRAYRPIYERQI